MLKVLEPISNRVYYLPEGGGAPVDICTEGYRLENDTEVQYIGGKWIDHEEHEYTPVKVGAELVGFERRAI